MSCIVPPIQTYLQQEGEAGVGGRGRGWGTTPTRPWLPSPSHPHSTYSAEILPRWSRLAKRSHRVVSSRLSSRPVVPATANSDGSGEALPAALIAVGPAPIAPRAAQHPGTSTTALTVAGRQGVGLGAGRRHGCARFSAGGAQRLFGLMDWPVGKVEMAGKGHLPPPKIRGTRRRACCACVLCPARNARQILPLQRSRQFSLIDNPEIAPTLAGAAYSGWCTKVLATARRCRCRSPLPLPREAPICLCKACRL